MESDVPRLARGWAGGLAVAVSGAVIWAAFMNRHSLPVLLILLGVLPVVGASMVRILSTTITNEGVSQRTWRGWTHLRWVDVRSVRFRGKGSVVLTGPKGDVIIPGAFYTNFDALLAWLANRLPHVWPA